MQGLNLKQKLTSRKFLIAVAGLAVGIATMLGVDSNDIKTVAGAFLSIASVLGYSIVEGNLDIKRSANQLLSENASDSERKYN